MKVRDLIDRLAAFDPDCRVLIDGYEGGFEDVHWDSLSYEHVKVEDWQIDSSVYGPWADAERGEDGAAVALVIRRETISDVDKRRRAIES